MAYRPRSALVVTTMLCSLLGACLGQDARDVELTLTEWDHGWLAVVEPDKQFSVTFRENPQYPDAAWVIAGIDPPTLEVLGFIHQGPGEVPEGDPTLPIAGFEIIGTQLGEATVSFEIVVGGRTVDRVEYEIGVVEDACEGDDGLAAPRCDRPHEEFWPHEISELDHGRTIDLTAGEVATVQLTANAVHPDAAWALAGADSAVVDVSQPRELATRTPGNWDTTDTAEPGSFLPRWEFLVTAAAPGTSLVRFEMRREGILIEFCELTFEVAE